jgi:mono/diheme cytochrome c family protein
MFTFERLRLYLAGAALLLTSTSHAGPDLGQPATAADIAAWELSIPPSGQGLPPGSGTPAQGAVVYSAKCASCHGANGAGKPADALAGGRGSLSSATPLKTVGSYWPYATTLFDYVRRAMPYDRPLSLSDDEVYAVSAYILALNGIIREDAALDAKTLPQVAMPKPQRLCVLLAAAPTLSLPQAASVNSTLLV